MKSVDCSDAPCKSALERRVPAKASALREACAKLALASVSSAKIEVIILLAVNIAPSNSELVIVALLSVEALRSLFEKSLEEIVVDSRRPAISAF